jgi:Fusaric acid resistance protein-like
MSAARDLVSEAFRTDEHRLEWRAGIAGAVATVGPLAIGIASGEAVLGLIAGIGGLNTSLCIPGAGLRSRLWWGSLAAASEVGAFALANVVRDHDWAVVVATLLWVSGWAFVRAAGRAGAIIGFANAAVFVVLAGIPASPEPFGERLLWFSFGVIASFVLVIAARRGPEPSKRVVRDSLEAVRVAVTGRGPALRAHAARLGLAVAAGTLFYLVIDLAHGYWVPLTTLAILQPEERATRVRSLQRAVGTFAGAGLIIAITLATHEPWALAAGAAVAAFGLFALDERGYFWLVALITPTVLFMLSAVDFQGDKIGLERLADSSLGILIGLAFAEVAWRLWPSPVGPAPRALGASDGQRR